MFLALKFADVRADLLDELHLRVALLDVIPVDAAGPMLLEGGGHRLDRLEEVGDGFDVLVAVEDAAADGGLVGVVGDRVPGAEDEVVEAGQRHKVPDQRHAVFRALAEADGAALGERPDGLGGAATQVLDAGEERRRHGAEADDEHAELALRRRDS